METHYFDEKNRVSKKEKSIFELNIYKKEDSQR